MHARFSYRELYARILKWEPNKTNAHYAAAPSLLVASFSSGQVDGSALPDAA